MTFQPVKALRPHPTAWCLAMMLALATFARVQVVGADDPLTDQPVAGQGMYAPADLVVVDVERSMRVFSAEGEPVPLVVRVDSHAASLSVEQLNEAFDLTHSAFLSALEKTYGSRQIEARRINSPRFRSFQNEFQSANPLFPVNLILVQSWARGYDGDSARERLASAMEDVMRNYYLANFDEDAVLFIAAVPESMSVKSWDDAATMVRLVEQGEVIGLEEAGSIMRRNLDVLDLSAAGFLTGLLQPTVKVDPYLTGLLMHERLGPRVVMRTVKEGAIIARAGEPVDHWAELTINTIERMGLEILDAPPGAGKSVVADSEAPDQSGSNEDQNAAASAPAITPAATDGDGGREQSPFLLNSAILVGVVVGGSAVCFGFVFWILYRKRSGATSLVARSSMEPSDLREAIIPHLARELKNRLVRVLFAQRHALLENEEAASERVREMEARLARLQPAIAEKIRSYEKRIQVLEQEIEEKDQETRDLLRAKLVLARKELDEEISRNRIDWN